jgi:hypothetical protein
MLNILSKVLKQKQRRKTRYVKNAVTGKMELGKATVSSASSGNVTARDLNMFLAQQAILKTNRDPNDVIKYVEKGSALVKRDPTARCKTD